MKKSVHTRRNRVATENIFLFFLFFMSCELLRNNKTTRLNAFNAGNLFFFFYVYTKEARRAHPAPTLNATVVRPNYLCD